MKAAIVTEGFQGTGYGHLTRCLSIYQAFEERNILPLFIANCDDEGKKFIPDVNLLQLDWLENFEELIKQLQRFDIVIIDSYLTPLEMYERIYKSVKKVVYIDDYIRLDYPPGIIVNGTIGAEKLHYKKDDKHKYLLGIEYMPLRKEFWDVEIPKRENRYIKNVLITFGAQDIRNLTAKVLSHLLKEFPQFNYHVVVPNNYSSITESKNVFYHNLLSAKEMLNLMLKSDLAITAAGQTINELARLGKPTIAVGVIENQLFNINNWVDIGFIHRKNWYSDKELNKKILEDINFVLESNLKKEFYCNGQGMRNVVDFLIFNKFKTNEY